MLYAGSDLSRPKLDVHLLTEDGQTVETQAVRPIVMLAPGAVSVPANGSSRADPGETATLALSAA